MRGKTYYSYLLEGTWGEESEIWYAPEVGFLSKLHEILNIDDINAGFDLWLLDTTFDVSNDPPNQPDIISGPAEGDVGIVYTFETVTSDNNNHDIYYKFDWGDDSFSDWIGAYTSDEVVGASHSWSSKGMYNAKVKAIDDPNGDGNLDDGIESIWSEPYTVSIIGKPFLFLNVDKITKLDEIDWDPFDSSPTLEWYYKISVCYDDLGNEDSVKNYNTIDGENSDNEGDWFSVDIWNPRLDHGFEVEKRFVSFQIKLMDRDLGITEGGDDLADISGNKIPDTNGVDDNTGYHPKAIYHGVFDMVRNEILVDSSDFFFFVPVLDVNIIRGDDPPDNSIRYEHGLKDPENDAMVYFKIFDDYEPPSAFASVANPFLTFRPGDEVEFLGGVSEGSPDYSWSWGFGDGTFGYIQNPTHIYSEPGEYTVRLTVTDLLGEEAIDEIIVVINENNIPILSDPQVEFENKGGMEDTFTFSVSYYDEDADVPSIKHVVIDGVAKDMTGEGGDSIYFYECLGKDLGKGNHRFYFTFNDGYGGSVVTEEQTVTVQKSSPKNYHFVYLIIERFFSNTFIFRIFLKILEINSIV